MSIAATGAEYCGSAGLQEAPPIQLRVNQVVTLISSVEQQMLGLNSQHGRKNNLATLRPHARYTARFRLPIILIHTRERSQDEHKGL